MVMLHYLEAVLLSVTSMPQSGNVLPCAAEHVKHLKEHLLTVNLKMDS